MTGRDDNVPVGEAGGDAIAYKPIERKQFLTLAIRIQSIDRRRRGSFTITVVW